MKPVTRTDHVGSLLRPRPLLDARADYAEGRIPLEELRQAEDLAILQVIAHQRDTGIGVISDGEFRRAGWLDGFRAAVDGFVPFERTMPAVWKGRTAEIAEAATRDLKRAGTAAVGGKLRLKGRFADVEAAFLVAHAPRPFKITLPSPASFQMLYEPGLSERAYKDPGEMLADIVEIHKREVSALVTDGVPYIQLDSLRYGDVIDDERRARWRARGVDPMAIVDETLAADNAVLAMAKGAGVIRAMHICRGNHRSAWAGQGGYEPVAEKMLGQLDVDRFLLEYDDERSGSFDPLRHVPGDRIVVLGLVSSKKPRIESVSELRGRIMEAARCLPLERLCLSPQCGFASTMEGNRITPEDQRRKLERVAETARAVWG